MILLFMDLISLIILKSEAVSFNFVQLICSAAFHDHICGGECCQLTFKTLFKVSLIHIFIIHVKLKRKKH